MLHTLKQKFQILKQNPLILSTVNSPQRFKFLTTSSTDSVQIDRAKAAPKEKVECVVIGAGVVGIAVARALALKGREVVVVDSASTFGTGTSSRNSEVVHAGIYYPPNSFKATFCVRGRKLLYEYCSEHDVPHKQIGKLIVATRASEVSMLDDLMNRGIQNGVDGLRMMEGHEAMRIEPELQCVKALLSPVTGIVDTHSLMLSMVVRYALLIIRKVPSVIGIVTQPCVQGEAEGYGATFSYNTAVIGGHLEGECMHLHISESKHLEKSDGKSTLQPELILVPKLVVNSAGLSALALARKFHGLNNKVIPPAYYARGCYFSLSQIKNPPFKHLIYPMPEDGGIGVHVTIDLDGQVKFGPDVEWINGIDDMSSFLNKYDYSVTAERAVRFYPEIRKYYPNLKDGTLEPGYAGIRPKLTGPRQPAADFVIQGEDAHGVPGLVNLLGIESPGLTSSFAIAKYVSARFSR